MVSIRFGNFALDWSTIYAVRVSARDFENVRPIKVALMMDLPHIDVGVAAIELQGHLASRVLEHARRDQRFTFFGKENELGVDMTKVVAVQRISKESTATIVFRIGDRSGTIALDPSLAIQILESFPDTPIGY